MKTLISIINLLCLLMLATPLVAQSSDRQLHDSVCGMGQTIIYPAPDDEEASTDYSVKINNIPVFIYQARVSSAPINQIWPGYQRPLEQTEFAAFGYFDTDEVVDVEIESRINIKTVTIRPISKNIKPQVTGNRIYFQVKEPCQLVVEVNDHHHALHLFVNPVEKCKKHQDQYTWYFGHGRHQPGIIELKDNETVYIEGGAIVETLFRANNAKNVKIQGRGIVDASSFERDRGVIINFEKCENVTIEGIILKDSPVWTLTALESRNVSIDNVKLIGNWRYNSDGIDIVNSRDVTVNNSFIRAFDDCIAIKGTNWSKNESSVSNVHVNNCVIWCDWGTAIQIGSETVADSIHHCFFSNCDIIHYHFVALGMQCGDKALVFDIHYEDIRVEEPLVENSYYDNPQNPIRDISKSGNYGAMKYSNAHLDKIISISIEKNLYSQDDKRGKVYNISYKNIQSHSNYFPKFIFTGYDENHDISDVFIEDIFINGKKVNNMNELILSNDFVRKIIYAY